MLGGYLPWFDPMHWHCNVWLNWFNWHFFHDTRRHFHQWHFLSTTNSALSGRTFEEGQFPDEYQFEKHEDVQLSVAAKYLQKLQLKWKLAYADEGLGLGLGLGRAYFDLEFVCSAGKQPMMRRSVNVCVPICLCCLFCLCCLCDPLSG